jgi:acetoin:2,6-dichlorophenolindophenol oxidoreductase subunit alpha
MEASLVGRDTIGVGETPALDLVAAYRRMLRIRVFEDTVQQIFLDGLVPGTTHLCQGQEAVAVGVAAAMRADDYSTYTYRGHGHAIARGMDVQSAFAEIMGRSTGVNRGKGGSMHLTDARLGLVGSFAIVGAGLPIAVGLGRASQLRGTGQVSVSFFGDGATNIGAFHEALNLAAVWKAPVVFVCENNLYGEYTRYNETTPVDDLATRAGSYAMRSMIVDGNDVQAVYHAASDALASARRGDGPTFVECKTYRQRGHSRSDPARYRPDDEVKTWLARDPLTITRRELLSGKVIREVELDQLVEQVESEIAHALDLAVKAPLPSLEEITRDVYA